MPVSLDTRKAHLVRQHGDLMAVYTWVNDERAMVLIPARRPGAPWYIVMESAAYRHYNQADLATQCVKAREVLGIEPSRPNWVPVSTIIYEGRPDIVRMRSATPAEQHEASFGRMELRADGDLVNEAEVRLDKEGALYG